MHAGQSWATVKKVFKGGYVNVMLGSDHRSAGTRAVLFSSSSWSLTFANKWTCNKLKFHIIVIMIRNLITAWFHKSDLTRVCTRLCTLRKLEPGTDLTETKNVPLRGKIKGRHVSHAHQIKLSKWVSLSFTYYLEQNRHYVLEQYLLSHMQQPLVSGFQFSVFSFGQLPPTSCK